MKVSTRRKRRLRDGQTALISGSMLCQAASSAFGHVSQPSLTLKGPQLEAVEDGDDAMDSITPGLVWRRARSDGCRHVGTSMSSSAYGVVVSKQRRSGQDGSRGSVLGALIGDGCVSRP